jgi:outer membrane protein OmpA-like peptidoglycan-associated protein
MEIFFSRLKNLLPAVVLLASTQVFAQADANFPTTDEPSFGSGGFESTNVRLLGTHPTGAVGLFHTFSALKQPYGSDSFAISLLGNYYLRKTFPINPYITERFYGNVAFSYTPSPLFEVFLNMGFLTTNNEPPQSPLIKQNLNFDGGVKFARAISPKLTAGAVYVLEKRSPVSVIAASQMALNHNLLGVMTYNADPIRFHTNLGYRIDNNKRVTAAGTNPRENQILKAIDNNAILFALSGEYLMNWLALSLEYSLDYVSATTVPGFADQLQRVTFGTRIFPTRDQALVFQAGIDYGLFSKDSSTAPIKEPPFGFWFGLSYLFGMKNANQVAEPARQEVDFPKEEPVIEKKTVEVAETTRGEAKISGFITNIETGDPIENVKIYLCSPDVAPIVTDRAGEYKSFPLPFGSCEIRLEHPEYKTVKETVQISANGDQTFDFGLMEEAREKSSLLIRVKDKDGNPTEATVSLVDHDEFAPVDTNEFGQAKIPLKTGNYSVIAKAPKFKPQTRKVILGTKDTFVDFALEPEAEKPPVVKISKDNKTIEISDKIQFEVNKSLLTYNSTKILDVVVTLLKKHPEIKKLAIGGHTDATGDADKNMKLSQERADAVKAYLVKKGIAATRLESKGYGQTKLLSDEETQEAHYLNRRVEFKIKERTSIPAIK